MPASHLRVDLSILRQGLSVGWEFGLRSLEDLGAFAELLQHSVYETGSLTRVPGGVGFVLLNPPLRMGAFSAIRIFLNGQRHPDDCVWIHPGNVAQAISLTELGPETPVVIPVGLRTRFLLAGNAPIPAGHHEVRLELQSVAIPPLVWFEFSDDLLPPAESP
jgi:hypothetical protein